MCSLVAASDSAEERCRLGFELLQATVRMLGFETNTSKNEPPATRGVFLGGGLDSDTEGSGRCSKYIDPVRRAYVIDQCLQMEHKRGHVRVHDVQKLQGLLSFCATLVERIKVHLQSGFQLIRNKNKRDFIPLSSRFRQDLCSVRQLLTVAAPRTIIDRRPVTSTFASWDASSEWGMGGFLDGDWFSISWAQLRAWPQKPAYYPRWDREDLHTIAYLELFAGYWFLKKWARRLSGYTAVVFTDNTNCQSWLKRWTGPGYVMPLLKAIEMLLCQHDVVLEVHYIASKSNVLSDCLSRGDEFGFEKALKEWSGVSMLDKDLEDHMLDHAEVESLESEFGVFTRDACVDKFRTNSHCTKSWNADDDCRKQDWSGQFIFCNGPFSLLLDILQHFLRCKTERPLGTAAIFILPCWPSADFFKLIMSLPKVFRVVRRWPAGSDLFTAPIPAGRGGGRRRVGPTRWPVVAVLAAPTAI